MEDIAEWELENAPEYRDNVSVEYASLKENIEDKREEERKAEEPKKEKAFEKAVNQKVKNFKKGFKDTESKTEDKRDKAVEKIEKLYNDELQNGYSEESRKKLEEVKNKAIADVDEFFSKTTGKTVEVESAQNADNKKAPQSEGEENVGEVSNKNNKAEKEGEVVVTGKEFGEYKDIMDLRKKAVDFYAKELQGTSVENKTLGKIDIDENGIVNFTGAGKREFKNSSAKVHKLLLVKHLKQLISEATNIEGKESTKAKHDGEYFYYLHTEAKIENKKTPVEITLIKRNDGSIQYYNHTLPMEENKQDAVVSTGPVSSNEALGTPSIPASFVDTSISQNAEKGNRAKEGNSNNILKQDTRGVYDRAQKLITLMESADESTLMHESTENIQIVQENTIDFIEKIVKVIDVAKKEK